MYSSSTQSDFESRYSGCHSFHSPPKAFERALLSALAVAANLYKLFAYFYHAMRHPPEAFGRVMMHAGPAPLLLLREVRAHSFVAKRCAHMAEKKSGTA